MLLAMVCGARRCGGGGDMWWCGGGGDGPMAADGETTATARRNCDAVTVAAEVAVRGGSGGGLIMYM